MQDKKTLYILGSLIIILVLASILLVSLIGGRVHRGQPSQPEVETISDYLARTQKDIPDNTLIETDNEPATDPIQTYDNAAANDTLSTPQENITLDHPLSDQEMAAKITEIFQEVFTPQQSQELAQLYTDHEYHHRIIEGPYAKLLAKNAPAEKQIDMKRVDALHKQVTDLLRQNRALKAKDAPYTNVSSTTSATSTPQEKKEYYLPGPDAIKGLHGEAVVKRTEIPCPDRITDYRTWPKVCQELQFQDGSKSIIYIVTSRGITARDDFDAQGHLRTHYQFWSRGGYFDSKKIMHVPDYPSTLSLVFLYDDKGAVHQADTYLLKEQTPEEVLRFLQEHNESVGLQLKNYADAPQYCDLYPLECEEL